MFSMKKPIEGEQRSGECQFSFHVALGEPDVGREHDAAESVLILHVHAGAARGPRVAEGQFGTFGQAAGQAVPW
jgi:hypothetical protein